ncbi:hypothetical protein TcCL_Unassigned03827 [Trypanosoma cruzi]|nr:hypothetical protein TcCL_Unassigned03827 [Trypanosoma cruzi]
MNGAAVFRSHKRRAAPLPFLTAICAASKFLLAMLRTLHADASRPQIRHSQHRNDRCCCVRGRAHSSEIGTLDSVVIMMCNWKVCSRALNKSMKRSAGSRSVSNARLHDTKPSKAG